MYKITCLINKKVYIGQTTETIEYRFKRHMGYQKDSFDTKFYRAIRKYGTENFVIEQIDSANNQEELNEKEYYWINYYDAVNKGYNTNNSKGKCGGDTLSKHKDLDLIKEKISKSKFGGKNPMAKKVVATNIITNEIIIYDSLMDCARALSMKDYRTIRKRCVGMIIIPYKKKWLFKWFEGVETIENTTNGVDTLVGSE